MAHPLRPFGIFVKAIPNYIEEGFLRSWMSGKRKRHRRGGGNRK
jgi:hypothetical protein